MQKNKNNDNITPITAAVFSLLTYLALTAGSGSILLWSLPELIAAIIFAAVTALLVYRVFNSLKIKTTPAFLNPIRWILLLAYALGPFFIALTKANLDVAYRVLTGKINPGIVKIKPDLETDLGITLLANSITLTPGTLSVDLDEENNLFIHWINVKHPEPKIEDVCSCFPEWIRRITQ
ncbi:MAG: cation:proton antiporter [Candidatus Altiarchaeales archaeon ex4484_96]|nr:MAG: cation:proton antiporter [Candidatus Altiarchaeales archaeon ex4484_96]